MSVRFAGEVSPSAVSNRPRSFLDLLRQHGEVAYTFVFLCGGAQLAACAFCRLRSELGRAESRHRDAVCWFGSFVGDVIRFCVGRRFGTRWLGSVPGVELAMRRVSQLTSRHYVWMILLHRYPHGIRGVAGFAYGMSPLPWAKFLAMNFVPPACGRAPSFRPVCLRPGFGKALERCLFGLGLVMLIAFLGLSSVLSKSSTGRYPTELSAVAGVFCRRAPIVGPSFQRSDGLPVQARQ